MDGRGGRSANPVDEPGNSVQGRIELRHDSDDNLAAFPRITSRSYSCKRQETTSLLRGRINSYPMRRFETPLEEAPDRLSC